MRQKLLFEIGTEEIPAPYIMPALEAMKRIMGRQLSEGGLEFTEIKGAATPRRLALGITGLPDRQPDLKEEVLGPPKKAAFDADNQPTKAALGFAKSRGVAVEDLKVAATPKGEYLMVLLEKKGVDTIDLLPGMLAALVHEIPFPKSMRWGAGRIHFARPIQWLMALYGGTVVPFDIDGVASSAATRGHRFMAPQEIKVKDFSQYLTKLRRAGVMADPGERRQAVAEEIARAAQETGGRILPDAELLETVTHLVESPHAVCGVFDERFLALPREVLITSMREHQKYFTVVDDNNNLLPHFVAVNNTKVKDAQLAAEGHQRVLRARLEDAFFFFKEDQAKSLADRVDDLSGIIFQAKLGTVLEKTGRITSLASKLAKELAPDQLDATRRAAQLAKADLLSSMVNEFPSLQGVIGREYALLSDEKEEVAIAIHEHYLPVRAGDEPPRHIPGALIGIADRLDTIAGCFGIGQTPTGATDPFGLRRLALGLIHIIETHALPFSLPGLVAEALALYGDKLPGNADTVQQVMEFIKGRYVNALVGRGIPHAAVEAVTSVSFDDVNDCSRRINALVAVNSQPAFPLLAGAFKRVMNIIKDHADTQVDEKLLAEPAEKGLYKAFKKVSRECKPLLDSGKYEEALAVILKMKEPVDLFFDEVMVMADDKAVRNNRLSLLSAISRLFLRVGDFSKMYAINS